MSKRLEDYGLIGNTLTAALVARDGSLDWLCVPRFDCDACLAALLGGDEHGRWRIAPAGGERSVSRRYRSDTAVLETTFDTDHGRVTLIDFMPFSDDEHYVDVVRLVRADEGRVPMRMELTMRFGYGRIVPWLRREDFGLSAVAGPDALELRTPIALESRNLTTTAEFSVGGQGLGMVAAPIVCFSQRLKVIPHLC